MALNTKIGEMMVALNAKTKEVITTLNVETEDATLNVDLKTDDDSERRTENAVIALKAGTETERRN